MTSRAAKVSEPPSSVAANGKIEGYRKEVVQTITEATRCSTDEVIAMLKACDGDVNVATEKLLESTGPSMAG